MEGPLEIKSSAPATDEPIKSEQVVRSPDNGERSDGAASPPPNCSICLGKLVNTSFTDSCLHQFCFTCLLQWSKIKTECPLCKQTFKSIIHNVRSEEDYDQYHVPRELASQISQSPIIAMPDINFEEERNRDFGVRRFYYRTTMTGNRRPGMLLNPEQVARREQLPSYQPQISREESRRRRANPEDYRRTVYRLGVWASSLPDIFGRFRECSAEYYRRQPRELDRLIPWLNRELQVLLNNNVNHVAYVLRVIMEALVQYDIRSPQFRDLVRPYFGVHTELFVHELLNYARTNFDLVGYDQSVMYLPQGLSNEYVTRVFSPTSSSSSTTSDDSDVRVLEEAIDLRVNAELPNVRPHAIDIPGPSTVAQAFQIEMPYTAPDILTISSNTSSSDDECEIVGYVKPRHERTPEIIELLSSDPEEVNTCPVLAADTTEVLDSSVPEETLPSTSSPGISDKRQSSVRVNNDVSWIKTSDGTSTSETIDSDSDSDYSPRRNGRYRSHTKTSKRSTKSKARKRSDSTKSRDRSVRNLSSSSESDQRKRNGRKTRRIRKRSPSCSDSSFHENITKRINEAKSKKGKYLTRGARRIRDDSIEDQESRNRYSEEDSSSTSGSESEEKSSKSKHRTRKLKKYFSTDTSEERVDVRISVDERTSKTRTKNASRTVRTESVANPSKENLKEERRRESYTRNSRSHSRSSSEESSYVSRKDFKDSKSSRVEHESRNDNMEMGDGRSQDENSSTSKSLHENSNKRKDYESKARTEMEVSKSSHDNSNKRRNYEVRTDTDSTSDSDRREFDSSSRRSEKSHVRRKKSKHKDRYKEKEKSRKRSGDKVSEYEFQYSTSTSSTSSLKKDSHRPSRHTSRKNGHRDRHESSKHRRRSQSDSKSRCKKRKRIRRSSSSSQ